MRWTAKEFEARNQMRLTLLSELTHSVRRFEIPRPKVKLFKRLFFQIDTLKGYWKRQSISSKENQPNSQPNESVV